MLWRHLNPALLRYLGLSGEPAEDVASDTWATVVKGLRTFTGDEGAWRAWVFITARRRAVDTGRKRARAARLEQTLASFPIESHGVDPADVVASTSDTDAALRLVALVVGVPDGVPVDASGPAAYGLCTAWTQHQTNGASANGKADDAVAFKNLATAAGGADKIAAYCANVLASPQPTGGVDKATSLPTEASTTHPGKPTAMPTQASTDHPGGKPTSLPTQVPTHR